MTELRKKILIVDDSVTSILMSQLALSRRRYDIITARNGAEGVDIALSERPDLVLLDITMPVMDGFEMLAKLRSMDETASTPVIMVTTHDDMEIVERGYATGCNDYVTKPVDGSELLSKVESWLSAE